MQCMHGRREAAFMSDFASHICLTHFVSCIMQDARLSNSLDTGGRVWE